jgi:hypothetical protein
MKISELFRAKRAVDVDIAMSQAPQPPALLSEELARRDTFFHTCWTRLKFLRPDLCREMTDIELFVAGYERTSDDGTDNKSDDEQKGKVV